MHFSRMGLEKETTEEKIKEICQNAECPGDSIVCIAGLGHINLGDKTTFCIGSYYTGEKLIKDTDEMYKCPHRIGK